jgi:outer membrane protein TolC
MVKSFSYILIAVLLPVSLPAQDGKRLDLQQAYELSRNHYPIIQQKDLIRKTAAIRVENLQKGFLPQLNVHAQATYQSDVTEIPVKLPGLPIETLKRDQYKMVADINQLIYDGGVTREQKILHQLNADIEAQQVEVELYELKERVSELYLGILYLDAQLLQVDLVKADIETGIKRVDAQVQNGVAFKSNLNMLKAEFLKANQRATDIKASRKGLVDALALFLGKPLDENVILEKPQIDPGVYNDDIVRPELKLYEYQTKSTLQQYRLISAQNLPKTSLFVQGGYGRPGLNMLKNGFDLYYMGGIRMSWSLGGLYTKRKEREQVDINKKIIAIQKETFLLNTNSRLKRQQAEMERLEKLVQSDKEIIMLRKSVTDAAKAQLENGVITANDYLKEINAEDQARQSLLTHEVQLLQAQIIYQTISGKQ